MNREQAKKALLAVDPHAFEWVDLDDLDTSIREAEEGTDPDVTPDAKDRQACVDMLSILEGHRDHLRTEDDALAVWREVFVGQAIRVDGWGKLAGAASIADEAEAQFRRRFADYLKAKG